jgi:hypothetical protein
MFSRSLSFLILLFFTSPIFAQDTDESYKKSLRASYLSYLTEQGYKPELDDDLDIRFKSEGSTYYIIVKGEKDFTLSKYLNYENACGKTMLLTLNEVNLRFRNVTAYALSSCDAITISSRSWLKNKQDWKSIFSISLKILQNAENASYEYIKEFE